MQLFSGQHNDYGGGTIGIVLSSVVRCMMLHQHCLHQPLAAALEM